MNKTTLNISVKNNAGITIKPSVIVGDQGSYSSGDMLDANAVEALINQKIANVVGGATNTADTLKEIEDKVNALKMSQVTNDAGYVQQDANGQLKVNETNITNTINKIVVSNQPFPTNWPTGMEESNSFSDLITAMIADTDITAGKVYLATVGYDDLPNSLIQAELKIEVTQWNDIQKIAVFTLSSSNQSPYNWHNTLVDGLLGSWYSYALVDDSSSEPAIGE